MTEMFIAKITFKTNENDNSFLPITLDGEEVFIVEHRILDGEYWILQLTCEDVDDGEGWVGMPFYEFVKEDKTINVDVTIDFDFHKHFRYIKYDRYILRDDEKFISLIKTTK